MKAILYSRYSSRPGEHRSEGTTEAGEAVHRSIAAQEAVCREWCLKHGHEPAEAFHDDAVSRDDGENREAMREAIAATKRGMVMVVADLDRLGNEMIVGLVFRQLNDKGAKLASVTQGLEEDTPERQLMRTLLGAMASYQRAGIKSRQKKALRRRIRNLEVAVKLPPYGLERDPARTAYYLPDGTKVPGKLRPCIEELQVIRRIQELRQNGATITAISNRLNEIGSKRRNKKKWKAPQIWRILRRYQDIDLTTGNLLEADFSKMQFD